jgi:hypothetical protein
MPSGVSDAQRIDTRALVSMSLNRTVTGALRGTGQVDSFTVRSSITEREKPVAATAATPVRPS